MKQRFILHITLCVFLAGLGYWLYLQLGNNGSDLLNSISVANYWFGFLVFVLFSWLFYWLLHKRSTKSWLIALLVALIIAVTSTVAIPFIAREHENIINVEEKALSQDQDSQILSHDSIEENSVTEDEDAGLQQ